MLPHSEFTNSASQGSSQSASTDCSTCVAHREFASAKGHSTEDPCTNDPFRNDHCAKLKQFMIPVVISFESLSRSDVLHTSTCSALRISA